MGMPASKLTMSDLQMSFVCDNVHNCGDQPLPCGGTSKAGLTCSSPPSDAASEAVALFAKPKPFPKTASVMQLYTQLQNLSNSSATLHRLQARPKDAMLPA